MTVSSVSDLNALKYYTIPSNIDRTSDGTAFDTLLDSAVNLIHETNDYTNKAEEEEIRYALGMSDGIQDLQVAQQKANISLQYTVAVRNAFLDGYKEIMNLSF